MSTRLPAVTLLMIAAAVVIAVVPGMPAWLMYDRSAILNGQIWRLFTGHWVHFSTSHLVYDSLVLGIAGWIIETKRLPYFGCLCLLAPWFISSALLVVEPRMQRFGGLSALATMAVVYLALFGLRKIGLWRWVCAAVLVGVIGKVVFELATGRMIFVSDGNNGITVCAVSHVCGAMAALGSYGWTKFARDKSPAPFWQFDDKAVS